MYSEQITKDMNTTFPGLLTDALQALEATTGLAATAEPLPGADHRADALVRITRGRHRWKYVAHVETAITHGNLGAIAGPLLKTQACVLVAARHITPPLAARLKALGLEFIDTAGNAYLDQPQLFVFVVGRKPPDPAPLARGGTIFRPAALRVLFVLLCLPGFETRPLREIADAAGVALGTVNNVLRDLERHAYMAAYGGRRARRLLHKNTLMTRWAGAYADRLRPKLQVNRYAAPDPGWWKRADLALYGARWGGEVAAAKLVGHLKPGTATLYLEEKPARLILDQRLKQDPAGNVEILHQFWHFDDTVAVVVPPLLIYADLLAVGDERTLETARLIYDEKLVGLIE